MWQTNHASTCSNIVRAWVTELHKLNCQYFFTRSTIYDKGRELEIVPYVVWNSSNFDIRDSGGRTQRDFKFQSHRGCWRVSTKHSFAIQMLRTAAWSAIPGVMYTIAGYRTSTYISTATWIGLFYACSYALFGDVQDH